jgi:hypothetical protein
MQTAHQVQNGGPLAAHGRQRRGRAGHTGEGARRSHVVVQGRRRGGARAWGAAISRLRDSDARAVRLRDAPTEIGWIVIYSQATALR